MTVFLCGGSKSGKSDFAQQVALTLAGDGPRYYVATMIPGDGEDFARIRSHLARRAGMGFETLEEGQNLLKCLEPTGGRGTFLVDSVTTLLTNVYFSRERDFRPDEDAARRCGREIVTFLQSVENAVVVSDNLFCDAARYDAGTQGFLRHLGEIHRAVAAACDTVAEMTAGCPVLWKGALPV